MTYSLTVKWQNAKLREHLIILLLFFYAKQKYFKQNELKLFRQAFAEFFFFSNFVSGACGSGIILFNFPQ